MHDKDPDDREERAAKLDSMMEAIYSSPGRGGSPMLGPKPFSGVA